MEKYDFEWALQKSRATEGWLRDGEEEFLYNSALNMPQDSFPIYALEIGSWMGRSTILIGSACKRRNTYVVAVDPHCNPKTEIKPAYDLWKEQGVKDTYEKFCKNIHEAELSDTVIKCRKTSVEARESIGYLRLGFIFIDGCHQKEYAEKDFLMWTPFLVRGGIVAMHDAQQNNTDFHQGASCVAKQYIIDSDEYESQELKGIVWGRKK